ncbi:MAG: hypothetical protein KJZ80_10660 [Hyphomicrobiaceae bacterium]|nr:hypothetical protein [Hyphomicrobiaceae bacterium]
MQAQQTLNSQRLEPGVPPDPKRPRSFAGPYLAAWALLAALALGYMTVLLLQPDWTGTMTTQALRSEPVPAASPLVQQLSREVDSLRRTVADLQREISYVKSSTALLQEANASLQAAAHGAGQQSQAAAPQDAIAAAQTGRMIQPEPAAPAAEPERREAPKSAAAAQPEASKAKKKLVVLNAKPAEKPRQPEALETGSLQLVEQPQITFGPPTITPAAEAVAIHLDAAPSLDALRLRWGVLHDRHQSALNNLAPRYLIGGTAESPSYQLLAGPVASPDEAARICALLRARRVPCSVGGPFIGEAL